MIRYLLDTNICTEVIRGRGEYVVSRLAACAIGEVGISSVTLAELAHGVEKSAKPAQNRIALQEFCAPLQICAFDDIAAFVHGRVRNDLEQRGTVIGPMDLLIAAHALALESTLVTNNMREFSRVADLSVDDWL